MTTSFGGRERALLDFERDWQAHQGDKEATIRAVFDISAARYYQLLARLIDAEEALRYDPLTVRRLRRKRDARRNARAARSLGQRAGH